MRAVRASRDRGKMYSALRVDSSMNGSEALLRFTTQAPPTARMGGGQDVAELALNGVVLSPCGRARRGFASGKPNRGGQACLRPQGLPAR